MLQLDLDRWLYLSGTSEARFANMVGVSRTAIWCWRTGLYIPNGPKLDALNSAILDRNAELTAAIDLGYIGAGNGTAEFA